MPLGFESTWCHQQKCHGPHSPFIWAPHPNSWWLASRNTASSRGVIGPTVAAFENPTCTGVFNRAKIHSISSGIWFSPHLTSNDLCSYSIDIKWCQSNRVCRDTCYRVSTSVHCLQKKVQWSLLQWVAHSGLPTVVYNCFAYWQCLLLTEMQTRNKIAKKSQSNLETLLQYYWKCK